MFSEDACPIQHPVSEVPCCFQSFKPDQRPIRQCGTDFLGECEGFFFFFLSQRISHLYKKPIPGRRGEMSALWEQTASVWCVYGERGPSPVTLSPDKEAKWSWQLWHSRRPEMTCQGQDCPLLDSSSQVPRHHLLPPHGSHHMEVAPSS